MALVGGVDGSAILPVRDVARWKRAIHNHASLEQFLSATALADGIHVIAYCGVFLELNLHRRNSKAMLVFFNAALAARTSEVKLPVFSGAKAQEATDANVLMVSDPVLYLDGDIRLGWYAGAAGMPLQVDLARVLQHIQKVLEIERVVLYGASGGGFAALFYAPFLQNSIAVPCNPQTNLLIYSRGILANYLSVAYGYQAAPSKFDAAEIEGKPVLKIGSDHVKNTRVLYLQNALDDRHYKRDFLPFLESYGLTRGKGLVEAHSASLVSVCGESWGEGHRGPPAAFIYSLLHSLTREDGWDNIGQYVPELYELTASRLRQVSLFLDQEGFHAQAWLLEPLGMENIDLKLYRDDDEVESLAVAHGEIGRFTHVPVRGVYRVAAQIPCKAPSQGSWWKGRVFDLFRRKQAIQEIRSRVVVVD
jgi:hypothetical protein